MKPLIEQAINAGWKHIHPVYTPQYGPAAAPRLEYKGEIAYIFSPFPVNHRDLLWGRGHVKLARKVHICSACGGEINHRYTHGHEQYITRTKHTAEMEEAIDGTMKTVMHHQSLKYCLACGITHLSQWAVTYAYDQEEQSMSYARKATMQDAFVKLFIYGVSGSGKSRFALSAPAPLVVDSEGSTRLYANDFDFWVAEPNQSDKKINNIVGLTREIVREILHGEYSDRETLVIDVCTDLIDELERQIAGEYETLIGKGIVELNAIQKTKWYSWRRDRIRVLLDTLKNLPMNLILVARAKEIWKGGQPSGEFTYDANPVVEYLMDVVIELRKTKQNEYVAHVKASRLANLPDVLPVKDYSSITDALKGLVEKSEPPPKAKAGRKPKKAIPVAQEVTEPEPEQEPEESEEFEPLDRALAETLHRLLLDLKELEGGEYIEKLQKFEDSMKVEFPVNSKGELITNEDLKSRIAFYLEIKEEIHAPH